MNEGKNTSCIIEGKRVFPNGAVKVSMRMLTSSRSMLQTNELPNVLHSIRHSGILGDDTSHAGFDYVLDFPLVERPVFPYVLDFILK
jgi:hypothetical protein